MFRNFLHLAVFGAGLAVVCWIGAGYLGTNPAGAAVAALIAACYLAGALELHRYRQATSTLTREFLDEGVELPRVGSHWIACDSAGAPRAIGKKGA